MKKADLLKEVAEKAQTTGKVADAEIGRASCRERVSSPV